MDYKASNFRVNTLDTSEISTGYIDTIKLNPDKFSLYKDDSIDNTATSLVNEISNQIRVNYDERIMDEVIRRVLDRMDAKPTMLRQCNTCGGTLEMEADKHIFICPYCGNVYAIGTTQINAR